MSLVGPRPVNMPEIARYGRDATFYQRIHPGITGLWQVSGRNDVTYERRVQLDRWYVRNWSLWTNIAILFKTVPVLLFRKGAYSSPVKPAAIQPPAQALGVFSCAGGQNPYFHPLMRQ